MDTLRVYAFQSLHVVINGGQTVEIGSPTARSLFAFLILHRSQSLDRRQLAFSLWPQGSEMAARRNLRQYVHRLRTALDILNFPEEILLSNQNELQINPHLPVWLDVDAFRYAARPDATLPELEEAIRLYHGDLLEDTYDDWCTEERQSLRHLYIQTLERLGQGLENAGRVGDAIGYARRWANAEPFDENAHRLLMRLYALSGERNRAIQHYQGLVATLDRELGAEPLPETRSVHQALLAGRVPSLTENRLLPRLALPQTIHVHSPRPEGLFVGREPQMKALEQALSDARNGQGSFVLITGESGIGKTRLVQEYLKLHPEALQLQCVCHELEATLPFAPLRRLLPPALDTLPASALQPPPPWLGTIMQFTPALARQFPYLPAMETASLESTQLVDVFTQFFLQVSRYSGKEPLHLIFDDLHWGDGQTIEFLGHIARQASAYRILVLGLCRTEDLSLERRRLIRTMERNQLFRHLPLNRLSQSDVAILARHLLPGRGEDDLFVRRLYAETEGNPFFIIEIVKALIEDDRAMLPAVEHEAPVMMTSVPLSIQRLIEARLDHLPEASQELLATAAATGSEFTFSLLEAISDLPAEDVVRFIEEWVWRDLVREAPSGYKFSHDKIRQVVVAGMSRARRQFVHRRIAEVLENVIPPIDASTLAHHYARGDQPLKALPHLNRAGELALQTRAYEDARQFGLQAVSLLSRMPGPHKDSERIDVNLQLAQAYAFSGDLVRAQEILGEIEHLALTFGDASRLGKLFHRSAQVFWLRGKPDVAGDYARRAMRVAEELGDERLLQAALRMLGRTAIAASAFDDAIAYLLRYSNLEAGLPPPDLPIVLGYLGVAYARIGSWERGLDAGQRGLALAEKNAAQKAASPQIIAFARLQLGFVQADYHDWQGCLEVLEPAFEFSSAQRTFEPQGEDNEPNLTPLGFMLMGLHGLARARTGRLDEGICEIRAALRWAEEADYRVFHYIPRIFLGEALLLKGEFLEAHMQFERALAQSQEAGNRWATGMAMRLLAETDTRLPSPDWSAIEGRLIQTLKILRQVRARPDLARTYLALRRLYDRAGQIAWAVDCHFRATSIFEELGMSEELRAAQGRAGRERRKSAVIANMKLQGPNF